MHPMLNLAVKAARRGGNIINRAAQNLDILTVTQKAVKDFVSEVDSQAEQAIIRTLLETYPKHSILAEESGASGDSEYQWIIDPLDGTTNFLHGFPQYAVSIGLMVKGVLTQAVVYDPTRNDLFTATRGNGAYLNNHRIRVSNLGKLDHALIGTGFPFREFSAADQYLAIFREVMQKTAGVRRAGSAALDLAYVAAGRLDAFWEFGLKPWDMAAGVLLITEAGGFVSDPLGKDTFMKSGDVVCGNPKIFTQLLKITTTHLNGKVKS